MLYLFIFKFHLQKKDHPSFSSISLHSAVSRRSRIIFCMSDGLATYYILLESSLQAIFEGACFTCVFLSFTCKNKDHPSFSSVSLHSAVSGRFQIIFCMPDGLATYFIPLESSLQEIFEGAFFTCVILSFTFKNKDHPSFSSYWLHSAVSRRFRIPFCMSDGLATYYIPLESSLQEIFKGACFTCVFLSFTFKNKDHPSFSSILLHSAVSRGFRITFCMSDGLATYSIPLERSHQEIFEGACFTCVFLSFTCKK